MDTPTTQNPDTREGLESWLSIKIHRIPVEILHLTEPECKKLHLTKEDFGRAFTLNQLWGLPTRQEVLRPSKPRLSLYSTKNEPGSTIGSQTSLSSHLLPGGVRGYL
jgi:hypothetical protein